MRVLSVVRIVSLLSAPAFSFLFDDTVRKSQDPVPTENYAYHKILDTNGIYHLFWKFNDTHITFETHVNTTGYVGFGLSSKSKMYPADVVTGWVKNRTTYFQDRHTVGHSQPIIDQSQDWTLLHGEESSFGTVLKFVRLLDTCDDKDYKITDDTVRVLYSYHPDDPVSIDALPYHGVNRRGARSVMFLTRMTPPTIPADAQSRDLLNGNYAVPNNYTTYHCRIFDFSDLGKKHHAVKFSPVVQAGHQVLIHHIAMYKCPGLNRKYIGASYECYSPPDKSLQPCGSVFLGWAIGGEDFYFPNDVGMPIAEPGDDSLYIMETHYNNPEMKSDFVDNSGMRITYTPTLRRHDAGLLAAGLVTHQFFIIPPYEKAFTGSSNCMEDCLNKGLQSKPNGVNVFAVWQHGHLAAEGITTRHIRNGVELEPLADDDQYDFDYQDYRHIHKPVVLQAGDDILVQCTYDSSKRSTVTHGGLSTLDEMCLSFIFYYPRMDVEMCQSIPIYNSTSISDYKNIIRFFNLDYSDPATRQMFQGVVADSNYLAMCFTSGSPQPSMTTAKIQYPRVPYKPPSSCHNSSMTSP